MTAPPIDPFYPAPYPVGRGARDPWWWETDHGRGPCFEIPGGPKAQVAVTRGGARFHSDSSCSNLAWGREQSARHARSRGRVPILAATENLLCKAARARGKSPCAECWVRVR